MILEFSGVWADDNCTAEHNGEPWDYGEETNQSYEMVTDMADISVWKLNIWGKKCGNGEPWDYGETNISKLQTLKSYKRLNSF